MRANEPEKGLRFRFGGFFHIRAGMQNHFSPSHGSESVESSGGERLSDPGPQRRSRPAAQPGAALR